MYRQAFGLCSKLFGPEHSDTINSISSLASCINNQCWYSSEAEPMYCQAFELCSKVFGPEHPDTINSINNLVSCIQAQGRCSEAEPMYRQALELSSKVFGPEHSDTINSIHYNRAICIQLGVKRAMSTAFH